MFARKITKVALGTLLCCGFFSIAQASQLQHVDLEAWQEIYGQRLEERTGSDVSCEFCDKKLEAVDLGEALPDKPGEKPRKDVVIPYFGNTRP